MRTVGVGGPAVVARIQGDQFIVAGARQLGRDLQVDLRIGIDDGEVGLVRNHREFQAVALGLGHQALQREQLGHVGAGLGGQLQVPEIRGLAVSAVVIQFPLHGVLADIVRGDRQQPVAVELIVQRLQIVERGARRFDDVAPAVVPPVLLQAEARPVSGMNCHNPAARLTE